MKIAELQRVNAPMDGEQADEVLAAIDELFTFKPWDEKQIDDGKKVREALADAYSCIIARVPSGPTRSRALNMLTDCRMLANAAITFKGEV